MSTTLKIYLDWDATENAITVRREGPGANNAIAQGASLGHNDALEIHRGTGWGGSVGLNRVDFYNDANETNPSPNNWTAASGVAGNVATHFNLTAHQSSNGLNQYYDSVQLQDNQTPQSDVELHYKVTTDNGKVLDPEVINKAGTGTGSAGWVAAN